MYHVRLIQRLAIDIHLLIDKFQMIAGQTNHALHKMLVIRIGKFENNDVPALQSTIRKKFFVPRAFAAKQELVHQKMVLDYESFLHRWRRNFESLHDTRGAKKGQNQRD